MSGAPRRRLTIVGGGYAGSMLAQKMDKRADVTVIEAKRRWLHNAATLRALARPDLLDDILYDYDGLLDNGRVVHGRVERIEGRDAVLDDGTRIEGDMLVCATGSSYASPFKVDGDDVDAWLSRARDIAADVAKAKRVVIVGGGPSGIELAGELAIAQPEKDITLVGADDRLASGYPARLHRRLARQFADLDVKLRLGEEIADMERTDAPFAPTGGTIKLADGFPIAADLVIPVMGSNPNTALFDERADVEKDDSGRLVTDGFLRPSSDPLLFALGDMAANGDAMTIVGLTRQVEWLDRALRWHLSGRDLERAGAYKPWPDPPVLVPLGPDKGASRLPVIGTTGPFLTSLIKGKKLFIPRYDKEFAGGP